MGQVKKNPTIFPTRYLVGLFNRKNDIGLSALRKPNAVLKRGKVNFGLLPHGRPLALPKKL